MTQTLPIPTSANDLTPAWITEALRSAGKIRTSSATSLLVQPMMGPSGLASTLYRVEISYDRLEPGAPRTLILKLHAVDDPERSPELDEVRFYGQLAERAAIPSPHCYYANLNAGATAMVLLLESLSDGYAGDLVTGATVREVELGLMAVAKMHAAFWRSESLDVYPWLRRSSETAAVFNKWLHEWVPAAVPTYLGRFGEMVPRVLHGLIESMPAWFMDSTLDLSRSPETLLHGDFTVKNLFFRADNPAEPVVAFDWALVARGPAAQDFTDLLVNSMTPGTRAAADMPLLKLYHAELVSNGAEGYSFEDCLMDYRRATLNALLGPVLNGAASSERRRDHARILTERVCRAVLDLDAAAVLRG